MAVRMAEASGRELLPIIEAMTEAEARLRLTFAAGEVSLEQRFDYWHSVEYAAFCNVHRRAGSSPVTAKSVTPDWSWESRTAKAEEDQAAATSSKWLAFAKAASGKKGK